MPTGGEEVKNLFLIIVSVLGHPKRIGSLTFNFLHGGGTDVYRNDPMPMDHLHYRLNFDLNKSRQKFHHSLKEHHKISNIPKFRCEML